MLSICTFTVIILLQVKSLYAAPAVDVISLKAEHFEHIQFKKIKANRYTFQNQLLQIDVDGSASFLMLPFSIVKQVNRVSFEWRSKVGTLVKNG